jgi:digeranylgeranylglycerophospholipid reductase
MKGPLPAQVEVLVVGAGPAGLAAAQRLRKGGAEVLLVDARRRIGHPLRCAEATESSVFADLGFEPRPGWVRWTLENKLQIVNRPRLEEEIAAELATRGVRVEAGTAVTAVGPYRNGAREVTLATGTGKQAVRARLVIAADGVASSVTRLAGLAGRLLGHELGACLALRLQRLKLRHPRRELMHFAPELKPYYFWILPSGPDEANVGVSLLAPRGHAASLLLDRYVKHIPELASAVVVERIAGFVPSAPPLPTPHADGLVVVGAAARLVDPVLGAGIKHATASGKLAAEVYLAAGRRATAPDLAPYRRRLEPLYRILHLGLLRRYVPPQTAK